MKPTARRSSLAVVEREDRAGSPVDALRARFDPLTQREAVLLDFLEDDLREAQGAMDAIAAHLEGVVELMGRAGAGREELVAAALDAEPIDRIDYLSTVLVNLRKRLVQVASRLG